MARRSVSAAASCGVKPDLISVPNAVPDHEALERRAAAPGPEAVQQ